MLKKQTQHWIRKTTVGMQLCFVGTYSGSRIQKSDYRIDFPSLYSATFDKRYQELVEEGEGYEKLRKQVCVPEKDDILVGKDGARYFEDIVIYKQDEQPALLSSIAILRADCKKTIPEFLYYTLKTPAVKKKCSR